MDLVGWTSDRGSLSVTPDALPHATQLIDDLGLSSRISARVGLANTTDAWNFGIVGGGSVGILNWTGVVGGAQGRVEPDPFVRYYHTQEDVYRSENYGNLADHLKVGLAGVIRADQEALAPVDFTAVAAWVGKTLAADAAKVPQAPFLQATEALKDFSSAAENVHSASQGTLSPPKAGPLNLWLMRTRKDLMPWLFGQGQGLRTSGYANTLASLTAARVAADSGNRQAVIDNLTRTNNIRNALRFSPEVARDERLYWYSSGDWASAYYQKQRPIDPAVDDVYRRLSVGGDPAAELPIFRRAEDEEYGYLAEAISIIAGKLRTATVALKEAPLH